MALTKKKHAKARVRAAGKTKTAKKIRKVARVHKTRTAAGVKKVVRIMGQGQFYIDSVTLKKLKAGA